MKIHHIGYAVNDMEAAIETFQKLGYKIKKSTLDANRKVDITFVEMDMVGEGSSLVELIAGSGAGSPVDKFLQKNGPSPYHICYEVDSIEETSKELRKDGWMIIEKASIAPAIEVDGEARVAFLYNRNAGIIELLELVR